MKHAVWDRLLIVLCAVILLSFSVLLLGFATGFLSAGLLTEQISALSSSPVRQLVLWAASAGLLVFSALVFWIVLPRRKNRYSAFAIQQTEHGTLKISVKALEHLVHKCILQHPELTIASSAIYSNEESVRVDLRVTLQTDINIPLAISALQRQIKQYVESCSGIDVEEVRVVVEATIPHTPGTDSPYAIQEPSQPSLPKLAEGSPEFASVAAESAPREFVDTDTSWLETKPESLSEGPGLSPAYQPGEPEPDWMPESEPDEHAAGGTPDPPPEGDTDGADAGESSGGRADFDLSGEDTTHSDTQEGG